MIGSILLLAILILLNAVFASAEIAVISMNEAKLKKLTEEGNKKAIKLSRLTEQPARFLATIQVAITLAGFLSSAFAADYFAEPLVKALTDAGVPIPINVLNTLSVVLITVILSYFSLIFGELVPKRIAMKKTESLALALSGLLYTVSRLFSPLVGLLTVSTNGVLRLMGIDPEEADEQVTEEEIRMMLSEGSEQGNIDQTDSEMIQNIFDFDDICAEQVCTHRIDVTSLNIDDSMKEWEKTIFESRHTYYPVYKENTDNIVGILDTKDYFRTNSRTRENVLKTSLDEPWFVPENIKANVLFQNMKATRKYFAVLIDEYGGMSGIITLHDLIETLVGDLYDLEDNIEGPEIQKTGEDTWKILGSAPLDDVAEALEIDLPANTFDTFSGYLCDQIGRVPANDESFVCETDTLKIQVHTVVNHRIGETTVTKKDSLLSNKDSKES
ncbi:MAG TPA: hemolysin family protein [Candidatus Anaerostipes avistercoris]|uniref:Hemolysin family protein n=1 Tax=Candidatus Anaerostipes avistercoris TaxID=2838462 RepID=A0A9D2PJU3_9FIRM|nr:hemolysin family protein [Candidatus Anaerostipes avistercoris]